ncbi:MULTISPECIES: c-type cytochrome biogenesis protein CcsB [unclassified Paenibacillus]|uniref:c-type cytochrome biogenesis protein CcsB n=1 Tax=unclassified Paenibacillus TaxID=185978 RepID=UPI00254C0B18|nr:c-type cytochrome biogenesis protein CcsB [Paenibacillus sp. UMB4589-SE434]MDK8179441.1 c-type cytochrome biogenesis protein CcsB [Paenibacillus sp. UMB4589-SE434]
MKLLLEISQDAYLIAFFLFCIAFIMFVFAMAGNKKKSNPAVHERRWGTISFVITLIGLVAQIVYFITRWIGGGHIPVSNMYEFMSFLSMMIIGAFIVMYLIYRSPVLGVFAVPLAFIIMAYASVFPSEVQPLIPQLDSVWLKIHVTMVALGYAFFGIGFIAGLMHLIRCVNWAPDAPKRPQVWLEMIMVLIVVIIGFTAVVFSYRGAGYEVTINQRVEEVDKQGQINSKIESTVYTMPPLIAPLNSEPADIKPLLGIPLPLMEAPDWMKGVQAARKLNTTVWSLIGGLLLYGIIRLLIRKPIAERIQPLLRGMDPDDLDEISYRSNAIGFPIFTLGGLVFAMIWAQIAWSRFWAWDPKEVWALITWLCYSAYLHLRLSRGFQGTRSSWLSVIGFIIVMFTLLGVNLIISGLHSYAGV